MDEENRELVWAQMKWAADELRGELPPSACDSQNKSYVTSYPFCPFSPITAPKRPVSDVEVNTQGSLFLQNQFRKD